MSNYKSKPQCNGPSRQHGVVMIVFGLSLAVLIGFLALVIDLGRTYVVRTELQNAADAAALAGAKELNQTLAGVTSAVNFAIAMAAQNKHKFSTPVVITIANISLGSSPDDSSMVAASTVTTTALAADKTFLKVNIPSGNLTAFFSTLMGTTSTNTFGQAVAGRFITNVSPIGICAINPAIAGGTLPHTDGTFELTEYGFRRGVSYNLFDLGVISGSSTPYLINPVDQPAVTTNCTPGINSANATAPFVCSGTSAVISGAPTALNPILVYGNTGVSGGPMQDALNTRFGGTKPSQCTTSNSDSNIRDYPCTPNSCPKNAVPGQTTSNAAGYPNTWMEPLDVITPNTRQTMIKTGIITNKNDYGVLWSYSRAVKASGLSPNAIADTSSFYTPADWPIIYPGPPSLSIPTYPWGPTGAVTSPYTATGTVYEQVKAGGILNHRVLNLAMVNCTVTPVNVPGCGDKIEVVGIGKFFMQVPADLNGSPKKLEIEFTGLVQPIATADVKLYR